jgi:chlorophyll synthase
MKMVPAEKVALAIPADFSAPARRVPALKTCLELLKPVTWFAPIWALFCGVVSSGQHFAGRGAIICGGLLLAGPMICGTSQAVNDWYDRHVDAINEPKRPIPSGRMPGRWGLYIGIIWTGVSLLLAAALGRWVFYAAIFGLFLAWAYSAPPPRLKRNGWWGNAAVGICYEGVPWFTGAAMMSNALPGPAILLTALLYSIGAHGIMTLNDFKSVDGDRAIGINSLPVLLGPPRAAKFACLVMTVPQIIMIGLLYHWGHPYGALGIVALLLAQFALMRRMLADPRARAPWYNATGTTLYVLGMLLSAFALAGYGV